MGDADITPEKEIRAMMTATDDERMRRISCEIVQEDIDKAREEGREEGFEKGLEAGREAGREEGFEEGLEKGLEEAREAREEMVRSLLGRLFARRVGRQPSTVEERALVDRTRELGAEQVEDVLLGHEGEALVRWLLGSQKGNGKRSKSLAKKKR